MSDNILPLSFPRDYYLECSEEFDGSCIDCVDQELAEFNGDAEDIAYELAYTRYALAKEELEAEALRKELAEFKRIGRELLLAHRMSAVDWSAMRELELLLSAHRDAVKPILPKIGEKWRLKNFPSRIATITSVTCHDGVILGRVDADAPWTLSGTIGKSLDTWVKYYERIKEA